MIVTTSKDGTIKMFFVKTEYQNEELMPKFNFFDYDVDELVAMENDYILAYAEKSKSFEVWRCNTGEIQTKVNLDLEAIEKIIPINNDCFFVLGIELEKNSSLNYIIKTFVKDKVRFFFFN